MDGDSGDSGKTIFDGSFSPQFGPNDGRWKRLDMDPPATSLTGGLALREEDLQTLAEFAFSEIAFRMPPHQLEGFASILHDRRTTEAEKYVAAALIRNAAVAAEGILPLCQDTGTALVYGWLGENVRIRVSTASPAGDARGAAFCSGTAAIRAGAAAAYRRHLLRSSQKGPVGMFDEAVTADNTPAAIDMRRVAGETCRFCFVAKGGGSANRTSFSMESPALLKPELFRAALAARISGLGASGCPPYRIASVLGGLTPSQTLYTLELAALGLLDDLPAAGAGDGSPYRDREWERVMMELAAGTGVGAQFGGSALAMDSRSIRLPRHAASLPFAVGVSCSAHRALRALVSKEGWFVEAMEEDPGRFLPPELPVLPQAPVVDLDRPLRTVADELSAKPAGSFVLLSGTVLLARDAAHARFRAIVEGGGELPPYLAKYPIFYAGPTEAAAGMASGSFGPTTAGRMDSFLDILMDRGAALVTIAKGGRSKKATEVIASHRGAYLACIGGAAALAARDHVAESRVIDFPELGMEAVRLVRLDSLPAMVVVDGEGRDFYAR